MYLFDLQTVAPDSFQQITQAGDECVLLHSSDADLPVAQLHRFPSHLLHQHAFGLSHRSNGVSYSLNAGLYGSPRWISIPVLFNKIYRIKTHLISAFLQQSLYELPVGLCDDWRWQVGEFGLAESGAQVPGLLDVLLHWQYHKVTWRPTNDWCSLWLLSYFKFRVQVAKHPQVHWVKHHGKHRWFTIYRTPTIPTLLNV